MAERQFKRNDTKGNHWVRLLDNEGAPIDLTGCTVVFTLQDTGTGLNKTEREAATVRDQATYPGEVFYQPTAADRDTAMHGSEEWEVLYPDDLKESFPVGADMPVNVIIAEDLDDI